jgi:cyclase
MVSTPTRRDFLEIVLGSAAGLSLSSPASAQQRSSTVSTGSGPHVPVAPTGPHAPIAAARLSDNLVEFSGAGTNVVVVTGPESLVMINGGLRERSADLLKAIAEHTGRKRVEALFNTEWRPEYSGSNETIGKAGAKIIAHEYTKQYLGAEIFVDWQDRTYRPLTSQALPNQTFYTSGTMTVGSERIEYGHLGQAQTDGAIYVFFPGSNVLMTGDALSVGQYPIADYTTGGWLGGLIAANTTLLGMANADTRLVPGVGPIQTRADLQAQHDMLETLLDRFKKMMKQGLGPEDIIAAAPTKEFDIKWGNPDLFVSTAYRSMCLHVRELGGIV